MGTTFSRESERTASLPAPPGGGGQGVGLSYQSPGPPDGGAGDIGGVWGSRTRELDLDKDPKADQPAGRVF